MANTLTMAATVLATPLPLARSNEKRGSVSISVEEQRASWIELERQDWHLWTLAMLLMFVLGISLLSFMFPSAYWFGSELAVKAPNRAFIGFCVLLALSLVYLLQRQSAMRRLKRQLFEARQAVTDAELRADLEAFLALPGVNQFRDGLAMDYRRATVAGAQLAVVLFHARTPSRESMGHLTSAVRLMLRRGETIARISDTSLGVILPGMAVSDATSFAFRVEEHVNAQDPEIDLLPIVTGYPQEAASLSELERPLRSLID